MGIYAMVLRLSTDLSVPKSGLMHPLAP